MNRFWRVSMLCAALCVALSAMAVGASAKPRGGKGANPNGRILAVEGPVELAGTGVPWKLIRLLPSGDFDTSFGSGGGMMLPSFGEESVRSISVDSRGRALIGGGNQRLRVVRIGTKAKIDHSFGNHGWAEAGFGKGTSAALSATTIDAKGRILAAGRVKDGSLKTGEAETSPTEAS